MSSHTPRVQHLYRLNISSNPSISRLVSTRHFGTATGVHRQSKQLQRTSRPARDAQLATNTHLSPVARSRNIHLQRNFPAGQANSHRRKHNTDNRPASTTDKMVEQLPSLPPIARLSPLVIRILGDNPSKFTLQGTNTYLVGSGRRRILIDTGEGRAEWKARLRKVLEDEDAEIESVLLTHWHGDHVGGVEDVSDVIAQTEQRQSQSQSSGSDGKAEVKFYKNRPTSGQTDIKDGQSFATEGATLTSFFCPGHTNDHMAFVLEQEDAMFTGDNVLGHGTAVFEDLAAYMRSLETMQHQFSGRAYPGHGMEVEDGKGKIKEYIAHRREREEQALEVLKGERPEGQDGGGEGWRSMSMVKVIYSQYPEHLHGPAEGGLVQVLAKLEKDGKVVKCKDGTWKLADKASL